MWKQNRETKVKEIYSDFFYIIDLSLLPIGHNIVCIIKREREKGKEKVKNIATLLQLPVIDIEW